MPEALGITYIVYIQCNPDIRDFFSGPNNSYPGYTVFTFFV